MNDERTRHTPADTARAPEHERLNVCVTCSSRLVYPVEWGEVDPASWKLLLHCPNCASFREGIFGPPSLDAFDEELDRGMEALTRDYEQLLRANTADEIERFVRALNADAILQSRTSCRKTETA